MFFSPPPPEIPQINRCFGNIPWKPPCKISFPTDLSSLSHANATSVYRRVAHNLAMFKNIYIIYIIPTYLQEQNKERFIIVLYIYIHNIYTHVHIHHA